VSEQQPAVQDDAQDDARDDVEDWSNLKLVEWFPLVRASSGLVFLSLGVAFLYGSMAWSIDLDVLWMSPPIALVAAALGVIGGVRRLREIRSPDLPNTRHYWMLLLGGLLLLVAMLAPIYLYNSTL